MSVNDKIIIRARRYNLARKLGSIVSQLVSLGENDMGDLSERQASQFHSATDSLRTLAIEIATH